VHGVSSGEMAMKSMKCARAPGVSCGLSRTDEPKNPCAHCKTPLRLISVIKTEETIKKILATWQPWTCPRRRPSHGRPAHHLRNPTEKAETF
jgi:hypothetical protein